MFAYFTFFSWLRPMPLLTFQPSKKKKIYWWVHETEGRPSQLTRRNKARQWEMERGSSGQGVRLPMEARRCGMETVNTQTEKQCGRIVVRAEVKRERKTGASCEEALRECGEWGGLKCVRAQPSSRRKRRYKQCDNDENTWLYTCFQKNDCYKWMKWETNSVGINLELTI